MVNQEQSHKQLMAEWTPPEMFTHADKLSPDNPLAYAKYWGHPDGNYLTIIHALEWAIIHLRHCQKELPCVENEITINLIMRAIDEQKLRHELRKQQGVLGTNKPHITKDI